MLLNTNRIRIFLSKEIKHFFNMTCTQQKYHFYFEYVILQQFTKQQMVEELPVERKDSPHSANGAVTGNEEGQSSQQTIQVSYTVAIVVHV